MITTQTATIDLDDLQAVRDSIAKANKKATKIGVPGYVLVEGDRGYREVKAPDPIHQGSWKVIGQVQTIEVEVLGEAPKYAGWTFVATLAWDHNEAVIRKIAGLEDIDTTAARANLKPLWCDHCNAARDRNETYLLRHEDGSFKQVGSTCLREFLGVNVNLSLIGYNPYEGCDSTNRYAPSRYSTLPVLEDTLAAVRAFGWTSAGAAYNDPTKTSTKERLLAAYSNEPDRRDGRTTFAGEVRQGISANHHEGDAERAVAVLAWIRDTLPNTSDYAGNLKAAVGAGPEEFTFDDVVLGKVTVQRETFRADNLGVVISAVEGYRRWEEKNTTAKAERVSLANSEFQGTVGEKVEGLVLTVHSARWIDSGFGSSLLVLFTDEAGNVFKWFASNPPTVLETVGTKVIVRGTVKKHETYNGLKSTVLTRCGVKEVVTA